MSNEIPTYLEFQHSNSSKIFESELVKDLTPDQINEAEKAYSLLLEKLKNGEEITEGFLSGILTGGAAALVGPTIMKAVCKCLGLDKGPLYDLLTSKLVLGSMGYVLGK